MPHSSAIGPQSSPLPPADGRRLLRWGVIVTLALVLAGLVLALCVGMAADQATAQGAPTQGPSPSWPAGTPVNEPDDIPNAPIWLCPSPTPPPSSTPCPTECWADPLWTPTPGAPTPEECGAGSCPDTPTPLPTATPYIRRDYFYFNQDVYAGPLRITLKRYWRGSDSPVVTPRPGYTWHYFEFELQNTGATTLTVWLPVQATLHRVDTAAGETIKGRWVPSESAMRNIGETFDVEDENTNKYERPLDSKERRTLVIGFEAPEGEAIEIGITLDNSDTGQGTDIMGLNDVRWMTRQDPYECLGNIEGPPFSDEGTPVPWPPPAGCPLPVPAGTSVTRGYGCSSFWTGTIGADCPAEAPYFHKGMDFSLTSGSPVYSVAAGTVGFAGAGTSPYCDWGTNPPLYGFGNYVRIDALGASIYYAHGQLPWVVHSGEAVTSGQQVMWSDSTGCSTGPHLHWEIRVGGGVVDPVDWLIRNVCPGP